MTKLEIKCFDKLDMYKPKAKDRFINWIKGFKTNTIWSIILLFCIIVELPIFVIGLILLGLCYLPHKLFELLCYKLF